MAFLRKKCPTCGHLREVEKVEDFYGERMTTFTCGHWTSETLIDRQSEIDNSPSVSGKTMFPFQAEGVNFGIKSNVRCLIADEMGLGKTIQALRMVKSRPLDLTPYAIFCKSSLKIQWAREIIEWCGDDFVPQIVQDSNSIMLPGLKGYIFSLDLLRRFNGELKDQFNKIGIRLVIIDECQLIKNPESQRADEVRKLCSDMPHIIALSGTPIKNRAPEYFSILNILRPEIFPVYERFLRQECDYYKDGYGRPKWGGLRYPTEFKEKTKDFIIRREREEVMPQLPKVNRQHRYGDLGDEVKAAYQKELDDFTQFYESRSDSERGSFKTMGNILAYMARMRHLTGLSKVDTALDFLAEFVTDSPRKITFFCHHKDVHQILLEKANGLLRDEGLEPSLSLTSDMDMEKRSEIVSQFQDLESKRVLIASTLAFGEGLNLQSCADCVIVERQWNPANEEQAEARFIRIGQKASQVNSTYLVAVGTIDEYLAELVERKRSIFAQTMKGEQIQWSESAIIKELSEILIQKRRKQWRI